jgi:hypothetical protein
MSVLDVRPTDASTDDLLDAALPVALLVAAASWLPVGVLLLGYSVRVLRAAFADDHGLPPLDDVRDLGRTGLRAAVVVVAFQLPVLVFLGITYAVWRVDGPGSAYGPDTVSAVTDPLAFARYAVGSPETPEFVALGLVVTGVVALLAGYAGTVSFVTLAATGRLAAAFDPARVVDGLRSPAFRRGFLLASLVGFVGSTAAGLVALVPVVGPFLGAFVELCVLVVALRVLAAGYDRRAFDRVSHDVVPDVSGSDDHDAPA